MWMLPLYLHVNQKSDYDYYDDMNYEKILHVDNEDSDQTAWMLHHVRANLSLH